MARFIKEIFGNYVRLEIIGETKEEVISWRDFFFNWGAIVIFHGNSEGERAASLSHSLECQEDELSDLADGIHLSFYAAKQRIIKAFESSLEVNTDWEKITEQGGNRARKLQHELHKKNAILRFEAIPTPTTKLDNCS